MSQRERNNRSNKSLAHGDTNQEHQSRHTHGGAHRTGAESSVHTDVDFRVMRCFCGCTALTHEEIEHFATMNVSTLIVHSTGKTLFRNFLRIGLRHDKSETMVHLDCFEMCNKFLRNITMIQDQDSVDDLLGLCPSYLWEQKITDAIQNSSSNYRNHVHLRQVLIDLKHECVHSIERHNDYDRFRRELLRKIGKS